MIVRLLIFAFGMEIQEQECEQADYHHSCQKAKKDFDGKSWIRHNFLCLNILEFALIFKKMIYQTLYFTYHSAIRISNVDFFTIRISSNSLCQGGNGWYKPTETLANQIGVEINVLENPHEW